VPTRTLAPAGTALTGTALTGTALGSATEAATTAESTRLRMIMGGTIRTTHVKGDISERPAVPVAVHTYRWRRWADAGIIVKIFRQ
jgi:hypothetical protein